jgi:hypothetical protein
MSYTFLKYGKLLKITCIILFVPIISWLVIYPFLPYGNHIAMAVLDNKEKNIFEKIFYSQNASKIVLNIRGVSCTMPILIHNNLGYPIEYKKENAIFGLMAFSSEFKEKLNKEQNKFITNHLIDAINECDVNNQNPLVGAITDRDYQIVFALIKRDVNVNQLYENKEKTKKYSPLYLAELFYKSEKNEENKQSLVKIMELLKQRGAKSEVIDLSVK